MKSIMTCPSTPTITGMTGLTVPFTTVFAPHHDRSTMGYQWVGQREHWDCGVAAIAMLLQKPYEFVRFLVPEEVVGLGLDKDQAEKLLWCANGTEYGYQCVFRKVPHQALTPYPGLYAVMTKTDPAQAHYVVVHNGTVYDPVTPHAKTLAEYGVVMHRWIRY